MTASMQEATKKSRIQHCPECNSTHLVEHCDEEECSVCIDCGFVSRAGTIRGKSNADPRRCISSTPCLEQPKSFAREKEASVHENLTLVLEKWKSVKIADSIEKNLVLALQFITEIAVDLSLPRIALRNASMMYQKMVEKGLIRGRSMKAMSAAAVYLGCRQCGIATTIKEIAHVSKISPEKISRSCRSVIRQLNLSLHPSGASDLALKMATRLHLPTRTIQFAEKTLKALNSSRLLLGKDPAGIAAAVIYTSSLLTGERKTQREIAEVGRITEATIRTRCRELEKNLVVVLHL